MREAAVRVLDLQQEWVSRNTPAMQERGHFIRDDIPAWLRAHGASLGGALGPCGHDFVVEGRDGAGPKAEIPWVRFGSASRSPNARTGWYCVYLFHALGEGFYLCLGHGSTRWENGELVPRTDDELAKLVNWARTKLANARADVTGLETKINLGARSTGLGDAYERGTAYAVWYPRGQTPTNESLAADAELFAGLLGVLYNEHDLGRSPDSKSPEVESAELATEAIAKPTKASRPVQGFGLSAPERKAVEMRAMAVARELLATDGYDVEDVSSKKPFDYRASKGELTLCVEVKGQPHRRRKYC